jgi:hypothetical protein
MLGGLVTSTYAACHSLAREIQRGTVAAVLAKPVGRASFLLAKYLGAAAYMLIYAATGTLAILMTSRTAGDPYQTDLCSGVLLLSAPVAGCVLAGLSTSSPAAPFPRWRSCASRGAWPAPHCWRGSWVRTGAFSPRRPRSAAGYRWGVLPSCALLALAILVLQAFAILLATRAGGDPGAGGVLGGLSGRPGFGPLSSDASRKPARRPASCGASPPTGSTSGPPTGWWRAGPCPWAHVASCAAYTALYVLGLLLLAAGLFRQIEVR